MARGMVVAEAGEIKVDCPHLNWPAEARTTVKLGKKLVAPDFAIAGPQRTEPGQCQSYWRR